MVGPGQGKLQKRQVVQQTSTTNDQPQLGLRRSARLTPTKRLGNFQLMDEEEALNQEQSSDSPTCQEIRAKRSLDLSAELRDLPNTLALTPSQGSNELVHTPSDSQSFEHTSSTSQGTPKPRGPTRCLTDMRKRDQNKKIIVKVDECAGRLVGQDSQYLITKSGVMVRQYAKFDGTTWKYQAQHVKDEIMTNLTANTNYDGSPLMESAIQKQLSSCYKNKQYRLHRHF